jgi:hypothetical protein
MKRTAIVIFGLLLILISVLSIVVNIETMENPVQIELVVSRYNEDLEWLQEDPFNKYPVICYNKGPTENFYRANQMKVTSVNNVGRESHTYLYHIVNNYDNLAAYTMFLPGSCNMEGKKLKAKMWISEIEKSNGEGVFVGKKVGDLKTKFRDFTMEDYASTDIKNKELNPDSRIELSEMRPYSNWYTKRFGETQTDLISEKGVFGMKKEHITQHPKSYYEDLLTDLDKHSNPETGHYFERSWAAVFSPLNGVKFIQEDNAE